MKNKKGQQDGAKPATSLKVELKPKHEKNILKKIKTEISAAIKKEGVENIASSPIIKTEIKQDGGKNAAKNKKRRDRSKKNKKNHENKSTDAEQVNIKKEGVQNITSSPKIKKEIKQEVNGENGNINAVKAANNKKRRNRGKKNNKPNIKVENPETSDELKTEFIFNTEIKEESETVTSDSENEGGGPKQKQQPKKKSRFVLFVGNLPYDVTEQDILEHFKKAATIKSIRLPKAKGDDKKARGIAFIDVNNEDEYQKCLSMHHTFIGKRQINVLYTEGKNKNPDKKPKEKVKNMKLHAMSQKGLLKSSTKENRKRAARRAKGRFLEKQKQEVKEETA